MADEETQEKSAGKEEKAPAKLATALSTGGGHAVVVAEPAAPAGPSLPMVSRRTVVIWGWWSAFLAMLGGIGVATVNFLWSRTAQRLSGTFTLDFKADELQPGDKRDVVVLVPNKQNPLQNLEAKIFIVRLTDEQAARNPGAADRGGAYLALSRKCPHLGCAVPYEPNFPFTDPLDNSSVTGWFRCPCHGSTYSDTGRRVFGPAPRSMDVYQLTIDEDGTMHIDLDSLYEGSPENGVHAVKPGETLA